MGIVWPRKGIILPASHSVIVQGVKFRRNLWSLARLWLEIQPCVSIHILSLNIDGRRKALNSASVPDASHRQLELQSSNIKTFPRRNSENESVQYREELPFLFYPYSFRCLRHGEASAPAKMSKRCVPLIRIALSPPSGTWAPAESLLRVLERINLEYGTGRHGTRFYARKNDSLRPHIQFILGEENGLRTEPSDKYEYMAYIPQYINFDESQVPDTGCLSSCAMSAKGVGSLNMACALAVALWYLSLWQNMSSSDWSIFIDVVLGKREELYCVSLLEVSVLCVRLYGDPSLGPILRSASACGIRTAHVVGRRKLNTRGCLGANKSTMVYRHAAIGNEVNIFYSAVRKSQEPLKLMHEEKKSALPLILLKIPQKLDIVLRRIEIMEKPSLTSLKSDLASKLYYRHSFLSICSVGVEGPSKTSALSWWALDTEYPYLNPVQYNRKCENGARKIDITCSVFQPYDFHRALLKVGRSRLEKQQNCSSIRGTSSFLRRIYCVLCSLRIILCIPEEGHHLPYEILERCEVRVLTRNFFTKHHIDTSVEVQADSKGLGVIMSSSLALHALRDAWRSVKIASDSYEGCIRRGKTF